METSAINKAFEHIFWVQNQYWFYDLKKAKICRKTVIFPVLQFFVPFSAKKRHFDQFSLDAFYSGQKLLSPTLQAVRTRFRANHIGRFFWFFGPHHHGAYPLMEAQNRNYLSQNPCNFWKTWICPLFCPSKNQCCRAQKMAENMILLFCLPENLKKNWRKNSLDRNRPRLS